MILVCGAGILPACVLLIAGWDYILLALATVAYFGKLVLLSRCSGDVAMQRLYQGIICNISIGRV